MRKNKKGADLSCRLPSLMLESLFCVEWEGYGYETRCTFLRGGRPIIRHLAPDVDPERMEEEHPMPLP